ncbi:flagellar motor switch protein FliG [Escherichia coli]|nr:flagellar motor switch protein FliG [Escherichia coli]EEX7381543.1 flagellar motor switch protein FliG [Escherichia coli]EEZ3430911.1 flagellar motor switch protein FliG [Escherichia coli]EFA6608760.1 flagellar motor switch protein FliG [Escherichia coli]EFB8405066.1 flagellar motor switch protein FliG [Escherichia coli]
MSNLTGTDKSVILLMTIGEDRAAEVFKHLSQREVQTLSAAMANVTQISNKQLTDVLAEFEQEAEQFAALNINANDYLRSVLVKALGEERAASLLEDILETRDTASGIETLNFMEPQSAADLIRDEHPQIIATILVHLKRAQAADILALFDERLRHDVMLRIATFGGVQPAALAELTEVLNGLLDGQNLKRSKMGGVRTAAEIINLMKTQQEEAVITAVREFDGELAQKIIDEMFLFENLVDVDDRSIQRLLQEVDSESLLIALKGAEQPLREKFLRNMSQRAADILRDDLANRGPVRLSQVENEQKAILLIVRRLAETGEMVIGSGEDTYWKTWTPDDLAPPQAEFVPMVEPEETIIEEAEPSLEQQLAQLQMQAHEQGYQAGIAEGRQQGHKQGYQEGLAQGLEQGLAEAKSQQAPIHARMQQLVSEFQTTLDALDSVIASRLMQMALEAARQVIGQTPTVDNSALIKQIQQLLQQEPLFSGKPQLRVHPDDLQRVDDMLGATLSLHGWRLRGDPTLHPGGCKVSADEGDLDASVATRWQELCRLAAPGVV